MIYLQIDDIKTSVEESTLDALTDGDYRSLEQIERGVLDMIKSYIGGVYNLDLEFSHKVLYERNYALLRIAKHLFAYDFYTINSVQMVSELVKYNYEKAIKTLNELRSGEIPDLFGVAKRSEEFDSQANSFSIFTSSPKINSIY